MLLFFQIVIARGAEAAQDPGELSLVFLRCQTVMLDQLSVADRKFPLFHVTHLRFAEVRPFGCILTGPASVLLSIRRFEARNG